MVETVLYIILSLVLLILLGGVGLMALISWEILNDLKGK